MVQELAPKGFQMSLVMLFVLFLFFYRLNHAEDTEICWRYMESSVLWIRLRMVSMSICLLFPSEEWQNL